MGYSLHRLSIVQHLRNQIFYVLCLDVALFDVLLKFVVIILAACKVLLIYRFRLFTFRTIIA